MVERTELVRLVEHIELGLKVKRIKFKRLKVGTKLGEQRIELEEQLTMEYINK